MPYDVEELQSIRNNLNASIFNYPSFPAPIINVHDVGNATNGLKTGKADGSSGLSSDHFINAGSEFAVHVSMLFSALLVHGCAPADICALFPSQRVKMQILEIPLITEASPYVLCLPSCLI